MWQLIINGPGYFDTTYELPEGETLLGRADENDIILSGDQVSRRHARFFFEKGKLFFEDLGSRNGTRVNGRFLVETHEIADKDVISIGENVFEVTNPTDYSIAKSELEGDGSNEDDDKFDGEVLLSRGLEENEFIENLGKLNEFSTQEFEMMPLLDNFGSSTGDAKVKGKALKAVKAAKRDKAMDQKELLLFAQVSERLNNSKDLHSFLDDVLGLVIGIAHANTGIALMFDEKGNLSPAVARGKDGQALDNIPISRSIVGEVVRKKKALAVMNAQDDENFAKSESVILYGLEQVICAPLISDGDLKGVIYLNRPASLPKSMKLPRLLDMVNALGHMMVTGIEKWSKREDTHAEAVLNQRLACFHSPETVQRLIDEKAFVIGRLQLLPVTAMVIRLHGLEAACRSIPIEKASALISDYYDVVRRIALKYDGTLGDFIGDGVLVVFGAPFGASDDADRALTCARACLKDCTTLLNQMLPNGPSCEVKVTLGTGSVLVGPVGTPENFEYALLGDAIDLAKEMHEVELSDSILVTDATLQAMSNQPEVEPAGELQRASGSVEVLEVVSGGRAAQPSRSGSSRSSSAERASETFVGKLPTAQSISPRSPAPAAGAARTAQARPAAAAPAASPRRAPAAVPTPRRSVSEPVSAAERRPAPAAPAPRPAAPAASSAAPRPAVRRPQPAAPAASRPASPAPAAPASPRSPVPAASRPLRRPAAPGDSRLSAAPSPASPRAPVSPRPAAPRPAVSSQPRPAQPSRPASPRPAGTSLPPRRPVK